jgi:carboxylesterase
LAPDVKGVTTQPEGASVAFLLVHGFCAAPDEVATLGEYLAERGIASFAVEIVGHAASSIDIRETSWREWYSSVEQGLELIKTWGMEHIFVAGLSMGGAASILLASHEIGIDGLVLMAPALRISGVLPKFVPILKYFMKDREIDVERIQKFYDVKRTKCHKEPLSAYHELFKLQKEARKELSKITIPTIILHGTEDKTINPENGQLAFDRISSDDKELHMIQDGEHVITCHPTRNVAFPLIGDFIKRVTG